MAGVAGGIGTEAFAVSGKVLKFKGVNIENDLTDGRSGTSLVKDHDARLKIGVAGCICHALVDVLVAVAADVELRLRLKGSAVEHSASCWGILDAGDGAAPVRRCQVRIQG